LQQGLKLQKLCTSASGGACRPLNLAIQDTTELNYTSHKALCGAGYLDSKYAQGLKVHSVLTASTQGIPLGIIEQNVWSRKKDELGKAAHRKQKPTSDKESQRWLDALMTTDGIIPKSVKVVTIADREADFYDLFACPRRQGSDFLIRGTQNRCLADSQQRLWETLESMECRHHNDGGGQTQSAKTFPNGDFKYSLYYDYD